MQTLCDRIRRAFSTQGTAFTAPNARRLELDVPELSKAMVQYISQLEAAGQLEYVSIRLHRVTPTLKLLCSLSSLRSLDLSHTNITNEELRCLQGMRSLVNLDLSSCRGVTDVSPISHIQSLEVVKLSECKELVAVGVLSRLPCLKELELRETAVTDEEIRQLSESRTLVKLDLSCEALTNVNPLSSIATLEVINLPWCASLAHVGALSKMPLLKVLNLNRTPITDDEICLLSESNTLVRIDLNYCNALTNVNPLSSIATLEEINLSWCTSLTQLGALKKLPVLKEVDLSETSITDEDVRLLSECQSLVKINLHCCRAVTNVNPLSSIATLEVINLSWCSSLTHLDALRKLPALKEVDLSVTPITDDEVRQLSECHTLVKIEIRACKGLTNVNPLSSIATLEVINLSGCTSLTHVGALGKLPALKEVDLSVTPITDDEVRLLGTSNTLVKIDFNYCKALTNVNSLSSIATLEVINLSRCTSLTHVGALGKLPGLKEVNLSRTAIADDEVHRLSECRTLVKIELNYCKALTNVNPLSSIATLEVINLSGCTSLTHVGVLGKLPGLKEVNLSETPVTDEDVRLLSECSTLVNIDLICCKALTSVNPLSSIATLEVIHLTGCSRLTSVAALGKLPVLKKIYLSGTSVTDKDVYSLTSLREKLGLPSIHIERGFL